MAHDPLDRTDTGRAVPDPASRYPRILLPGMAHLLALGRTEWVDISFLLCNLLSLAFGRLLARKIAGGMHPLFVALHVVVPASIVSLDGMMVDLGVARQAPGFAVYLDSEAEKPWKLYLVLAAAALCRDTGFV